MRRIREGEWIEIEIEIEIVVIVVIVVVVVHLAGGRGFTDVPLRSPPSLLSLLLPKG